MSDTKERNAQLVDAARKGDAEGITRLLAAGADANALDRDDAPVLVCAAQGGHTAAVQALLAGGASLDATTQYGNTALLAAANYGRQETSGVLLDAWERAHQGHEKECALLRAALWDDGDAVASQLAAGVDVHAALPGAPAVFLRSTQALKETAS